jgi:regulator of sirC expression with transglutaminase-like and TPR domain
MGNDDKIKALVHLLEDPDARVYDSVARNLIDLGPDIIPELELAWEQSPEPLKQQRIENLIQEIQSITVREGLSVWINNDKNLFEGAFLVAKYQYPELNFMDLDKKIANISKDAWLELNKNLTALENTRVLNYVFYKNLKFTGNVTSFYAPQNNFVNMVLETKKGNPISLGILYTAVARRLGLPVYGINLPKNFILAYIDPYSSENTSELSEDHVLFYINPFRKGAVLNKSDIENFLRTQKTEIKKSYFVPNSNSEIIRSLVKSIIFSFEKLGYKDKVSRYQVLLDLFKI